MGGWALSPNWEASSSTLTNDDMGKLKHSVLILGEGPTEFYYFNSLRDVIKGLTIKPDYPKHTSIKELQVKIEQGIADGYDHIFCVIDMDTKDEEPERTQYAKLKKKYGKAVNKPKKGIYCEVRFFETHRCTELFSFIISGTHPRIQQTVRTPRGAWETVRLRKDHRLLPQVQGPAPVF